MSWIPLPGDIVQFQDPGADVQFRALVLGKAPGDYTYIENNHPCVVIVLTRTENGKVSIRNQKSVFAIEPEWEDAWSLIARAD